MQRSYESTSTLVTKIFEKLTQYLLENRILIVFLGNGIMGTDISPICTQLTELFFSVFKCLSFNTPKWTDWKQLLKCKISGISN